MGNVTQKAVSYGLKNARDAAELYTDHLPKGSAASKLIDTVKNNLSMMVNAVDSGRSLLNLKKGLYRSNMLSCFAPRSSVREMMSIVHMQQTLADGIYILRKMQEFVRTALPVFSDQVADRNLITYTQSEAILKDFSDYLEVDLPPPGRTVKLAVQEVEANLRERGRNT